MKSIKHFPEWFDAALEKGIANAKQIDGWLTEREMRFLGLLAACPQNDGVFLEVGFYHGKSTSLISSVIGEFAGQRQFVTVDPIDSAPMRDHLTRLHLDEFVEVHQMPFSDLLPKWNRDVSVFWHDGANQYETVRSDLAGVIPYLSDGAIVAFHDVLNLSGERIRVFEEDILGSNHFGAFGFCGSIGWSQFFKTPLANSSNNVDKSRIASKLRRLMPFHEADSPNAKGLRSMKYRLLRSTIAHRTVRPEKWWKILA